MRKRSHNSTNSDRSLKSAENNSSLLKRQPITFNYGHNLDPFIAPRTAPLRTAPPHSLKHHLSSLKQPHSKEKDTRKSPYSHLRVPRRNQGKLASKSQQVFTNKILLLEYEAEEEHKPETIRAVTEQRESPKSEEEDQEVNAVVMTCMRVITQDTQHSSNPVSAHYTPHTGTPRHHPYPSPGSSPPVQPQQQSYPQHQQYPPQAHQSYLGQSQSGYPPQSQEAYSHSHSYEMMYPYQSYGQAYQRQQSYLNMMATPEYYYYHNMTRPPTARNRRAISTEESRAYVIDLDKVKSDGRTTIMVRNIPNKYTQSMLLELFKSHRKKFDFFYLPIDYNNNCNVGYAFLNFISFKFLPDFYRQFHGRKWNRFNSVKVCQVWYARIQGTAQLEHHFEHSNVLQQKDKRFRPLIGLKSLAGIEELVNKQKHEHASSDDSDEHQ